jgi:hypothetical protein
LLKLAFEAAAWEVFVHRLHHFAQRLDDWGSHAEKRRSELAAEEIWGLGSLVEV